MFLVTDGVNRDKARYRLNATPQAHANSDGRAWRKVYGPTLGTFNFTWRANRDSLLVGHEH